MSTSIEPSELMHQPPTKNPYGVTVLSLKGRWDLSYFNTNRIPTGEQITEIGLVPKRDA